MVSVSVLQPFAPDPLRSFFTTTASADFSRATPMRSPRVRCQNLRLGPPSSTWCVFRWRLDFVAPSTLIARIRPRCLFVFLRSRLCYTLLSGWPRGFPLAFHYSSRHSFWSPLFRWLVLAHAGHTGSELARDGGVSVNIDVEANGPIASKLAPTGLVLQAKSAV